LLAVGEIARELVGRAVEVAEGQDLVHATGELFLHGAGRADQLEAASESEHALEREMARYSDVIEHAQLREDLRVLEAFDHAQARDDVGPQRLDLPSLPP